MKLEELKALMRYLDVWFRTNMEKYGVSTCEPVGEPELVARYEADLQKEWELLKEQLGIAKPVGG